MAPRKDQDQVAAEKIKFLCMLMTSDTEFTPDLDVAAQGMNLAQAKNVTRKINSIIEPVGYTMKGRKIVQDDTLLATTASSTATTSSTPATTTTTSSTATSTSTKQTKTPTKKVAAKAKTPAKSPAKKRKRKLSDSESEDYEEEDDNEEEEEDSPATKAIKEAMAGSDVEQGDESSD